MRRLGSYACKAERRQGVRRFRPEMRRVADERARMLEMASVALRDERMFPHYQPKVCLKTEGLRHATKRCGCRSSNANQTQGYLFSRPVPAQEVPSALMQGMLQWGVTARSSAAKRRTAG